MENCIYKITSKINGKIYVGSAKNMYKRKFIHLNELKRNVHHNSKMQNHFNKYGIDCFLFEVIESNIENSLLIEREQYYLNSLNPFFNICKIAGSVLGREHSKETKHKISLSLKNKKHTSERRLNMSKNRKGVKPKDFTDNHKKNISLGRKGIKTNAKHKQKKVIQLKNELVICEFSSIKEASSITNINRTSIWMSLTKNIKPKGYEFKYK